MDERVRRRKSRNNPREGRVSAVGRRGAPPLLHAHIHRLGRESAAIVLRYLATMETAHWSQNAAAANRLQELGKPVAGAVENDHV